MKEQAIQLLRDTNRDGINKLIEYMEYKGFFESPASTKFHGNYKGGLLIHSMNIYSQFKKHIEAYKINFPHDSIVITSLLHDLCKAGLYVNNGFGYSINKLNGKGHAKLSLERIKRFIKLTSDEETIIKYHMSMYGTFEFGKWGGEYKLSELANAYNNLKVAKLFYFCDDIVSQFIDK